MGEPQRFPQTSGPGGLGLLVIQRLHRLVRHGFRPWLGYDAASGQDGTIHLRRKKEVATLMPDGTVTLTGMVCAAAAGSRTLAIACDDGEAFDARFPPNAPNRRNLTRRLYEIGL
ncbi:MAG: hypothetical protein NVSMB18_11620 [Acetobacteraceae bacterium]